MKVYFIAGLGADKRAFRFLNLSWCEPHFVEWLTPLPNETLPAYAHRLRATIADPAPVLVGVSFGGMLVTEMAKAEPALRAVIISSNKTSDEFPRYWRWWKNLPVYKWVPPQVIRLSGHVSRRIFGAQVREHWQLQQTIIRDIDPAFTKWAIHAILTWQNQQVPANLVHIHGTHDNLLPFKLVQPHFVIEKGRHLMIMDQAGEISELLRQIIVENRTP